MGLMDKRCIKVHKNTQVKKVHKCIKVHKYIKDKKIHKVTIMIQVNEAYSYVKICCIWHVYLHYTGVSVILKEDVQSVHPGSTEASERRHSGER